MLQNIFLSDTIISVVGKLPNTGKEVLLKWLNVQFAKKVLTLVMQWVILIEDLIKFGNQTSNVLAAKLTEHLENYMYVLPVWDPEKLRELSLET